MKKFQSLLNKRWTGSLLNTSTISGYWAEDGNTYEVIAPPQLVDQIVAMQNYVFDLNAQVTDMEENIRTLQTQLENFKHTRGYE